jgi:hypothetical protein
MYRLPSLLFAAVLMTSASAFAADTPDPSASKGEGALPSGSNAGTPPASESTNTDKAKSGKDAVATSPVEENKGKPKVAE